MTYNDLQWSTMTYNGLQWPTMIYNDLQWPTMIYNDLQWPSYNDRTRGPENTLKIPVAKMKILEKDKNKKKQIRGHVCINVTRLVYCMTGQMMTASLIITLGDKFTV